MTDTNEAWTYQVSPKLPDGTLVNIRGKEPFGFKKALEDVALLAPDIAATISALTGTATLAKAGVTGTSVPQEAQASNGFGTQQAQPPAQPQAPADPPATGPYTKNDKWGNSWEYGRPEAPITARGPAVLKIWTSQSGSVCRRWTDPAAGPEWFEQRKPKVDKSQQWDGDWFKD